MEILRKRVFRKSDMRILLLSVHLNDLNRVVRCDRNHAKRSTMTH